MKRKYTVESVMKNAALCKSLAEFRLRFYDDYDAASRKNRLNCIQKIKDNFEIQTYNWNKENCHELALNCESRAEFKKYHYNAYYYCINNNIIDEVCSHMNLQHISWSKKLCHELALSCKTRIQFQEEHANAYSAAARLKYLDEICSHMVIPNTLDVKRVIYAHEFPNKVVYIGLTKNIHKRELKRQNDFNDTVTNYKHTNSVDSKIVQLTDFLEANIAQIQEQFFINKYKDEGWIVLNKKPGGSLGGYKFKNDK